MKRHYAIAFKNSMESIGNYTNYDVSGSRMGISRDEGLELRQIELCGTQVKRRVYIVQGVSKCKGIV